MTSDHLCVMVRCCRKVSSRFFLTNHLGSSSCRIRAQIRHPDRRRWANAGSRRKGWSHSCLLPSGCPGGDVQTHPPKKEKSSETKPTEVPRSLHRSFHAKPSWKSSIMRSVDRWLISGWSGHQYAATGEAKTLVSVLSPSIKAVISRPSTIRCVKTEKTEETTVPQRITTSLPKQPRFCAENTAHTEALSSRMQVHFLQM